MHYTSEPVVSTYLEFRYGETTVMKLDVSTFLSDVEKVVVLAAAGVAAIKLKVFKQWDEGYKTEIEFNCQATNDALVAWAGYTIANTGDRPFVVQCVRLDLCYAKEEMGAHLVPDKQRLLVAPTFIAANRQDATSISGFDPEIGRFDPDKHHFKKIGALAHLGKSQRTIFTLCCRMTEEIPEFFFVTADWWRSTRRTPRHEHDYKYSFFRHLYVRKDATAPPATSGQLEKTQIK